MIAYKATYNFKCHNQTYAVGKTYKSDKFKIRRYGMHYCNNKEDTLYYYLPKKDFILLEVEILGDIETDKNNSVTNKLKILRVVPPDEYTDHMKSRFPIYEYDDLGNIITWIDSDGRKNTMEYDSSCNMISMTNQNGFKLTYEYDDHNNKISETNPSGRKRTYEYDDHGNRISETSCGRIYTMEYDEHGNKIRVIYPSGYIKTYDVAIITEED